MQTCKECCDNNTISHHPLHQLVHLSQLHLSMMHNDLQGITFSLVKKYILLKFTNIDILCIFFSLSKDLPNTTIVPHKKMQNCTKPTNGVKDFVSLKNKIIYL